MTQRTAELIQIKADLLELITRSSEWVTASDLAVAAKAEQHTVNRFLKMFVHDKSIQRVRVVGGYGPGVTHLYGAPGIAPPVMAVAEASAPRLPKKVKGFRAEARARHAKTKGKPRGEYKPRAGRVALAAKGAALLDATPAPRWAFASNNTLLLIGTPIEIKQIEARALVQFLSEIDEAGFLGAGVA